MPRYDSNRALSSTFACNNVDQRLPSRASIFVFLPPDYLDHSWVHMEVFESL